MRAAVEHRLLQVTVAVAALVPVAAGLAGVVLGPRMLGAAAGTDLDSHYRYLSGLLLALGIGFLSCVPMIERASHRFHLLGWIVVAGGAARLLTLALGEAPSAAHRLALVMELVVTPALMLWQARVARRALAPRPPA